MKPEGKEREKWLALLQGVQFFNGFSKKDLERILDAGEVVRYDLHQYVVNENEIDLSFFVLLKGTAKVIKMGALQKKREVNTIAQGDCFGEMGMLLQEPRTASILAAGECFIFRITSNAMESMPESTRANVYKLFSVSLARKLKNATEQLLNAFQY
ncbi:hypothetical protein MNBD_NITROSPINAE02-1830 [hydrothermal vent metagenome]|uniref:Cyclic nucleotide-binding domain-containing protein n=1 Tax=hydrothermal vent metagenome TaxID=652676 RepID=A0A3B1C5L6_9ZZZZ